VPFAEPPVGDLRWRAPQPLATKIERREVTDFAPACMQTMRILDWYRWMAESFGGSADYYDDLEISEDCLYLNVWTPTLDPDANLPVMVWIHGGSNKSGWSYEHNYHGHKLAQENVVVVSVAYRQGPFGFLSHSDLPDDEPRANFGYWDLIASLQWLQDNVGKFGGDPDRVTLFGESAGAENVLVLMFADAANGLFHRGIMQSSAGFGLVRMSTLADEQQRGGELASSLELPAENNLEALRKIPADKLLEVYYHSPAIDDDLLIESTWDSLHNRGFGGRQLIIGSNYHEWYASTPEDTTWDDVARKGSDWLEGIDYETALDIVREESDPRRAMDRLISAASMLCASQHVAATMTASGSGAWMYHFTRIREDEFGASIGAYHGIEYPYVFATHDSYMTTSATDLALEDIMQSYWVQFAATGDPNSGGTPDWPQFKTPDPRVQNLGDEVFTKPAPEPELCALFESRNTG
jgi:para-nitrobenzyl esterase